MIEPQRQSGKVTLEDLLRLKRAERPKAEFWADFDRTLHAKQLAAIVEKRPWWSRQSWLKASRWSVPLSAAAALAVTFATVGHPVIARLKNSPAASHSSEKLAPIAIAAVSAPSVAVKEEISAPSVPAISIAPIEIKTAPVFVAASIPVAKPASRALSVPEQIAGLAVSPDTEQSTARFASVSAKDGLAVPELGALFDKAVASLDLVSTRSDKSDVVEPLSQMQTPREARRARLVASLSLPGYAEQTDSSSNAMRSRERVVSHFNDQALYDAISRLDVKGKRASIQF